MFESPRSLQEVCIDFICGNVLGLCKVHPSDTNFPNTLSSSTISGKWHKKAFVQQFCGIKAA